MFFKNFLSVMRLCEIFVCFTNCSFLNVLVNFVGWKMLFYDVLLCLILFCGGIIVFLIELINIFVSREFFVRTVIVLIVYVIVVL